MANSHASKLDCERPASGLPRPNPCPRVGGLEPLVALRAKLAALLRASTSERLPGGHWVVICPEDLLGQLAEATGRIDRFLQDQRRGRASQSTDAVEVASANGLTVTIKLPLWLVTRAGPLEVR